MGLSKPNGKTQRLELGSSDPIGYTCICDSKGGQTLLFYRYFSKPPVLPPLHQSKISNASLSASAFSASSDTDELETLAQWHRQLLEKWDLGGRIRVGVEGFNGTVAGSFEGIEGWMEEVCGNWSFDGLGLRMDDDAVGDSDEERKESIKEKRRKFFKPSRGCKCVFGTERSVRVKNEITPMGVEGWTPRSGEWDGVVELEAWEWHDVFSGGNGNGGEGEEEEEGMEKERVLIDVRNYYESRIGYFVDPRTGKDAVRPAIRRFSQWPLWVRERMTSVISSVVQAEGEEKKVDSDISRLSKSQEMILNNQKERGQEKEIFTYCTGGIRCEKGVRFMQETLLRQKKDPQLGEELRFGKVYTLKGGIAAYLIWMDGEIAAGRKSVGESLFRGRNYVFDARGSTGLLDGAGLGGGGTSMDADDPVVVTAADMNTSAMMMQPVSKCHVCGVACDRLGKCRSRGCHLVLVVCEGCEGMGDVRCCLSCRELEERGEIAGVVGRKRDICECERERERELWGGDGLRGRGKRQQGWRKDGRLKERGNSLNIRVKTFQG